MILAGAFLCLILLIATANADAIGEQIDEQLAESDDADDEIKFAKVTLVIDGSEKEHTLLVQKFGKQIFVELESLKDYFQNGVILFFLDDETGSTAKLTDVALFDGVIMGSLIALDAPFRAKSENDAESVGI